MSAPALSTQPPSADSRHVTFSGSSYSDEQVELEGRLHVPADGMLHPGIVLCHANPASGGNMDMQVLQAIEAALTERGLATLRYNSRGIGKSTGSVSRWEDNKLVADEGEPETEDVGAALDFLGLQEGVDNRRMALVGHSFGARISLAYLAAHPEEERVQAVTVIGLPVAWRSLEHLGQWPHPKLFVTGERDDFCPPGQLAKYVKGLPEPNTVITLRRTGHFFEEREADLGAVVAEFMARVLG